MKYKKHLLLIVCFLSPALFIFTSDVQATGSSNMSIPLSPGDYFYSSPVNVLNEGDTVIYYAQVNKSDANLDVYLLTSNGLDQLKENDDISDVELYNILEQHLNISGAKKETNEIQPGSCILVVINDGSEDLLVYNAFLILVKNEGPGAFILGLIYGLVIGAVTCIVSILLTRRKYKK